MTTDIKKILDEIDGLYKAFQKGDWCMELGAPYEIAIYKNFPTLRDYIARLERESEAGKTAITFLEGRGITYYPISGENPSDTVRTVVKKFEDLHAEIIGAYRTSCEGEEK